VIECGYAGGGGVGFVSAEVYKVALEGVDFHGGGFEVFGLGWAGGDY